MVVMEKNYSSTDLSAPFDPGLSLPHFDEEATLLSARPVVPLHEVNAQTGPRRRVIFGLTILVAILVGAIGATLLMQSGNNSADSQVSQPEVSSPGAAGGSTSESAEARMPVSREPGEVPRMGEVPTAPDSVAKKRATAVISRIPIKPTVSGSSVRAARRVNPDHEPSEDFENDERELRRAELRDMRREARRQRRQQREQNGDDLLRIREIFEGSPRP